ncbi:MAG: hypothetical protein ABF946_13245, partial [Acetobacter papayae]
MSTKENQGAGATGNSLGGALTTLVLSGPELHELETALAEVESGRGVLVRLADIMGGAVGHAARLGLRGIGMAPNFEEKLRGLAETAVARAFDVAVLGLRGTADVEMQA